jgi:hypothetical protein
MAMRTASSAATAGEQAPSASMPRECPIVWGTINTRFRCMCKHSPAHQGCECKCVDALMLGAGNGMPAIQASTMSPVPTLELGGTLFAVVPSIVDADAIVPVANQSGDLAMNVRGAPSLPSSLCPGCDRPVSIDGCHSCMRCGLAMHGLATCGEAAGDNEMQRVCVLCVAIYGS